MRKPNGNVGGAPVGTPTGRAGSANEAATASALAQGSSLAARRRRLGGGGSQRIADPCPPFFFALDLEFGLLGELRHQVGLDLDRLVLEVVGELPLPQPPQRPLGRPQV